MAYLVVRLESLTYEAACCGYCISCAKWNWQGTYGTERGVGSLRSTSFCETML